MQIMLYVVQAPNCVWLFVTPWTVTYQAPLSFTISRSLLKFMSIESVILSNYLILCCPLFLFPWIFPSIRVFSNESALHIRWANLCTSSLILFTILWSHFHYPYFTKETDMATHSSILALKIPWKKRVAGLQSMGSRRVGHDWATSLHLLYKGGNAFKDLSIKTFHQVWQSATLTEHQIHWGPEPMYSLPYPQQCWAQAWHLQWWNMQVSDGLSQCKPQSYQPDQPDWNALLLTSDLFQPCILLHLPQRRTRLSSVSGWCLLYLSKRDFPQQTSHWAPASFLFSISLDPQNYCDLGTLQ